MQDFRAALSRQVTRMGFIAFMLATAACSAQDPSFVVSRHDRSQDETDPLNGSGDALGKPGNPGHSDPDVIEEEAVIVIKDNGLPPGQGGTIPDYIGGGQNPGSGGGDNNPGTNPPGTGPGEPGTGGGGVENELTVASQTSSFQAGEVKDGALLFSIDDVLKESRFQMSAEPSSGVQNFTQIERPFMVETHHQGKSASAHQQNFMQNENNGVLDILVVIDNSGSMQEEQAKLANNLPPLISYVDNANWRMGVVTTDNGCLRALINKGDSNREAAFAQAINAGINGNGNEQGIRYAVEGLNQGCQATPWLRQDSTVAVLIVSDEDNCSNGNGCGSSAWNSESYLYNYLASIRQIGVNARVYGIFWHPTQTQNQCSTGYNRGNQYANIVTQTNGHWGSICDNSYSSTLSQISQNISTILKNQFVLDHTPDAGSVVVKVNGQVVANGWSMNGNVLTFSTPPVEGATINVSYGYGAEPVKREFVLDNAAVAHGLSVEVNGVEVASSTYAFNTGNNSIEFNVAPPDSATIKVRFRRNVPLQQNFVLNGHIKNGTVSVKVNQVTLPLDSFEFDPPSRTIHIYQAPFDGANIEASFIRLINPVLNYPYVFSPEQQDALVYDLETGAEIQATFTMDEVLIAPSEFVYGRRFAVRDPDASDMERYQVELPVEPLLASVVAEFQLGECRPPDGLQVIGTVVHLEECEIGSSMEEGVISYSYVSKINQTFALDPAFFAVPHKTQIWRVWVDGQLITDYAVQDHRVIIERQLHYTSEVVIKVSLLRAL